MGKISIKIKTMNWKSFFLRNLGLFISAIASTLFISPSKMVASGGVGLATFFSYFTPVPFYVYLYGINISLIIVSFFLLGKKYTFKTIYGSLMLPTYSALISLILELFGYDDMGVVYLISKVDPFVVVAFAGGLMGVGVGINMKEGGSTGGFDIIESILFKYFSIPYSVSIYSLDAVLVILGMIFFIPTDPGVFANKLSEGLSAGIYVFLLGFVVDMVSFGSYNKKAVFIRTSKQDEVTNFIRNSIHRGLTFLKSEGGYSHDITNMIVCICYSKEYFALRAALEKIDPKAFIFVTNAMEVRGLGFNFETPEHLARRRGKSL